MRTGRNIYVRTETVGSAIINALFGLGFSFAMFRGRVDVGLWESGGLAQDLALQTFMTVLFSVIVPTILTRKRVLAGKIDRADPPDLRLPRALLFRAILVAMGLTIVSWPVIVGFLTIFILGPYSFISVLGVKMVCGSAVGAFATYICLDYALSD